MIDLSTRDRVADLNALADTVLRGLFTWAMPADLGVDYGFEMGGWTGPGGRRADHRSYTSTNEILADLGFTPAMAAYRCEKCGVLLSEEETYLAEESGPRGGPEPRGHRQPCFGAVRDIEEEWPPEELDTYARELWRDVGAVLRARGEPRPEPPKPPRPPWADMQSHDGVLVWSVPDELLPVAGFEAWEIPWLVGSIEAYDKGRTSASHAATYWTFLLALWTERKKVHDLTGGRG